MKKTQTIIAIVLGLAAIASLVAGIDARYAKASFAEQTAERLDEKIIQDRLDKLQERMWAMEDRWGERFAAEKNRIHDTLEELLHFMTKEARDHYRNLQAEYERLQDELDKRGKKKGD